ncbi:hypothetical protein C8T65DRAFT_652980 [Cerioporus squamosus]|nr:hypothetical protein C8T65DRAFT_652980 [Cerioporus squamosus]
MPPHSVVAYKPASRGRFRCRLVPTVFTDMDLSPVVYQYASRQHIYAVLIITTIVYYDWLLTLSEELRHIWSAPGRQAVASLVYLLARYLEITRWTLWAYCSHTSISHSSCLAVQWMCMILSATTTLVAAAFAGLRMFALSDRNTPMSVVIFVLSALNPICRVVTMVEWVVIEDLPSPDNCTVRGSLTNLRTSFAIASYLAVILAELIVIITTWKRTFKICRAQLTPNSSYSIASVMLRDGSLYFMMLFVLNIVVFVLPWTFLRDPSGEKGWIDNMSQYMINPISSIVLARFILNIRSADARKSGLSTSVSMTDLQFGKDDGPNWLTSLAGPVHCGFVDPADGDEDIEDSDVNGAVYQETSANDAEAAEVDATHTNGIVVEVRA